MQAHNPLLLEEGGHHCRALPSLRHPLLPIGLRAEQLEEERLTLGHVAATGPAHLQPGRSLRKALLLLLEGVASELVSLQAIRQHIRQLAEVCLLGFQAIHPSHPSCCGLLVRLRTPPPKLRADATASPKPLAMVEKPATARPKGVWIDSTCPTRLGVKHGPRTSTRDGFLTARHFRIPASCAQRLGTNLSDTLSH